ncbi:hypothetical protein DUI87_24230 [Hirundo rustica rustica]|uniref:Uncharacterized protein n=1 Tax=Hirundo rustica rustica TaxID=333673 RepID=A0A3M0JKB7_HIRRU|nr:hypothetical protein DUI87_24230 [Hirundo rustica rustica]
MGRTVSQLGLVLVVLVQGDLVIHMERMDSLMDQELVEQVVVLEVLDLLMEWMVFQLEQVLKGLVQGDLELPVGKTVSQLEQGDLDLPMERMVSQLGLVLVGLVQDLELPMGRMVSQLGLVLVVLVQENLELPMGRMVFPLEQVLVGLVVQGDLVLPMGRTVSQLGLVLVGLVQDLELPMGRMVSQLGLVLVVLVQENLELPMARMVFPLEQVLWVWWCRGTWFSLWKDGLPAGAGLVGLVQDLELPMGRMVSQLGLVELVQVDLARLCMVQMVSHLEQVEMEWMVSQLVLVQGEVGVPMEGWSVGCRGRSIPMEWMVSQLELVLVQGEVGVPMERMVSQLE